MKESRYFFVPDAENQTELPTDEAMHAMRVLRLKSGDELYLMDGEGNYFRAQVTVAATHHCYYEILEKLPHAMLTVRESPAFSELGLSSILANIGARPCFSSL